MKRFFLAPFVPRAVRRRVYKALYGKRSVPAFEDSFEVDFYGMRYRGALRDVVDQHVLFYGCFEKHVCYFLRDLARALGPGVAFVDVGANVGHHTLFLSPHVERTFAFEPYPPALVRLREKLEINGIDNCQVHPVALGERDGVLEFHAPAQGNLGTGTFASHMARVSDATLTLEVRNGDSYFAEQGIDRFGILKLDVEGFERPVLKGLAASLGRSRPVVVVEVSPRSGEGLSGAADILGCLPSDYRLWSFDRYRRGRVSRGKEAHLKKTGSYRLVPFEDGRIGSQEDVIAAPGELTERLPGLRRG